MAESKQPEETSTPDNGLSAFVGVRARLFGIAYRMRVILALIAFNGLFLLGNGLFMLIAPAQWYHLIPGVKETGSFNQHSIRDIGTIQMFLGAAFVIGMIRPSLRMELWAVATLWLIAHAIFHLWEVAVGICAPSAVVRDFPAVTLPALIGIALTAWAWHTRPLSASFA